MERQTSSSQEEEGVPLVMNGTGVRTGSVQQESRPPIIRTLSRESRGGYDRSMSSPTKAFRQSSTKMETMELEPENVDEVEQEYWGK